MIHALRTPPSVSSDVREQTNFELVGGSPPMLVLRTMIERFARSNAPVLIEGESGVGKELVARALHGQSRQAHRPLIVANVAALTPELLTSEIFGHVRGAFTSAVTRHRGLFEQAHESTLFLDEIGELRPSAQAALLRVLESGEVRPLGSEHAHHVHVRLLTATHRNLGAMVEAGSFRLDLFHRLRVLSLPVPPLRARQADLPLLVRSLLDRFDDAPNSRSISPSALAVLETHSWPGNVRELANVLRRACALTDESVLTAHDIRGALEVREVPTTQATKTRPSPERLRTILLTHASSVRATARTLGVARSTVRAWLAKDAALDVRPSHPPRRARTA